ncbi:MAG: polyribonucleotide nucleotidyltransferase, partial [Eubacteriales bacterium]
MAHEYFERSLQVGNRTLSFETGRIGRQAGGAILLRYGDTVISSFATASLEAREGIDFFPLTVDFEERQYAAGKIPGGFIKREGRPSEKATLSARQIDRSIRPLFTKGFNNDVQVVNMVMSVDQDCATDISAINAASAALTISDIPFEGPIAAVIVGMVNGEFVINPTVKQAEESQMNLTVAGTKDAIMMVEAGANEVSEEQMLDAIIFAHEEIKKIAEFLENYREEALKVGSAKAKRDVVLIEIAKEIVDEVTEWAYNRMDVAVRTEEKKARESAVQSVKNEALEYFKEKYAEDLKSVEKVLEELVHKTVRRLITVEHIRPDGRALEEIRPITVEVSMLPRTHG